MLLITYVYTCVLSTKMQKLQYCFTHLVASYIAVYFIINTSVGDVNCQNQSSNDHAVNLFNDGSQYEIIFICDGDYDDETRYKATK